MPFTSSFTLLATGRMVQYLALGAFVTADASLIVYLIGTVATTADASHIVYLIEITEAIHS